MRRKLSFCTLLLMLLTTSYADAQIGNCADVCDWNIPCSTDCIDGSLFSTCGDGRQ